MEPNLASFSVSNHLETRSVPLKVFFYKSNQFAVIVRIFFSHIPVLIPFLFGGTKFVLICFWNLRFRVDDEHYLSASGSGTLLLSYLS